MQGGLATYQPQNEPLMGDRGEYSIRLNAHQGFRQVDHSASAVLSTSSQQYSHDGLRSTCYVVKDHTPEGPEEMLIEAAGLRPRSMLRVLVVDFSAAPRFLPNGDWHPIATHI